MTLYGTLFVEGDVPYMVYAHEWLQMLDGTMEAVRLKPDLSAAAHQPFYLFKASDAPWLQDQQKVTKKNRTYVTDGPELYRTKTGKLLMIWSSYREGLYVETIAHSITGKSAYHGSRTTCWWAETAGTGCYPRRLMAG